MKILNKSILESVISAIIFVIIFIVLTVVVTYKFIESNIHKTYNEKNFMIEIEPKINKELEILSDIEGLKDKYNIINITNNNSDTKKYQILLSPINDDDSDIRVSVDNYLIRSLNNFEKDNNSYILYENNLEANKSRLHQIRLWQSKNNPNKKINVNFKLSVKILD